MFKRSRNAYTRLFGTVVEVAHCIVLKGWSSQRTCHRVTIVLFVQRKLPVSHGAFGPSPFSTKKLPTRRERLLTVKACFSRSGSSSARRLDTSALKAVCERFDRHRLATYVAKVKTTLCVHWVGRVVGKAGWSEDVCPTK